jgi:hypothetical protein
MSPENHLDDLPDLPDMPEVAPAAAAAAPGAPSGPPKLRVLDKAPQHLRLAAMIVMAGCVLPWMPGEIVSAGGGPWWLWALAGKVVMAIAAWLWLQQVRHDFGPKLGGVLGQLAELTLKGKKKDDEGAKPRRAKAAPTTHLEHPFPTGLHLLSLLLVIAAIVVAYRDPREGLAGSPSGIPEVAMFGWAAFTFVHIAGYERWGHFNPLFPLMFLGMLFAGAAAVLGAVTGGGEMGGMTKLMILAGGGLVAAGGGLAAYTIAEAMMQAKKQGDRKKADALEARKAARQKKA